MSIPDILGGILGGLHLILGLVLAPLLLGLINRTKALFAGRTGPPLLQLYFDLAKLLQKGAVYSTTTTWVFQAGPIVTLAAYLTTLTLLPFGGAPAVFSFSGDFILFAYLLAVARFFTVSAALDTGSSFEGMGASREVLFSALAEPALLLGLAAVARATLLNQPGVDPVKDVLSLSNLHLHITTGMWYHGGLVVALVLVALVVIVLVENCRIPFDDPNTHLELTMIHEVMVLDHGGPDLAYILYGAALKLWLLGALLVGLVLPHTDVAVLDTGLALVGMLVLAVLVGTVESGMARLRLPRVPQLLVGAVTLTALAFILEKIGGGKP